MPCPVHQVGQQRQVARIERVQAGSEDIGDPAFVDERSHLRLAHRQPSAVFNLQIAHRKSIRQNSVFRLIPFDDANELLAKKLSKSHVHLPGGY